MRHLLLGLAFASLTAGRAFAGELTPERITELKIVQLKGIPYGDDWNIRVKRDNCATGRSHEIRLELNAEGNPQPPTNVYCRYLLREFGKRGLVNDYYAQIAHQKGEPLETITTKVVTQQYERIRTAIKSERDTYTDMKDNPYPLTCALAYDVGYAYGFTNPYADDFPNLTEVKANGIARDCFSENPAGRKRHGYAAGVFHGRVDAHNPDAPFVLY